MRHYALIGDPVEHSRSPELYNELFRLHGVDADFVKLRIPANELKKHMRLLKRLDGFAVTMPHKRAVIPYLNVLDASAYCGSVNIVKCEEGSLIGFNTDGMGLVNALLELGFHPYGKTVAILGRGGAALSAAHALTQAGAKVTLLVRSINKDAEAHPAPYETMPFDGELKSFDAFINATPLGMAGHEGFVNFDFLQKLSPQVIFDMVYLPQGKTELVLHARKLGIAASGGFAMLRQQALLAFEIWCPDAV